MKQILGLLLLLACLYTQAQVNNAINYNAPREYEIGGITVSGAKYLNNDALIAFSGLKVGQKINIPGDELAQAVKKLWGQKLFGKVNIYITKTIGDLVFLNLELQEKPRLSKFQFKGIKKGEIDDIRDHIKLIRGKTINDNVKINAKNAIEKYYLNKGFLNVKIEIYERLDSAMTNGVSLTFNIDKGNKVKIQSIEFEGNENADASKLIKTFSNTKEKTQISLFNDIRDKIFKPKSYAPGTLIKSYNDLAPEKLLSYFRKHLRLKIFSSSKYLEDEFIADQAGVIGYYNSLGYRDATIENTSYTIDENDEMHLVLKINEGSKYYFGNITWKGNAKYSAKYLDKVLNITPGTIYNKSLLDEKLFLNPNGLDVSALYLDDGYLFFNITPKEISVENNKIDIEIDVYEGPQAIIDRVTIVGNYKTHERIIRRELRTLPGNKFSRTDIIRSQREIASLGFFDPEKMGVNPVPNPEKGTVDIEYVVEEKPSDQLNLSAGFGGGGLVGTLGFTFNNFSTKNFFKKGAWQPLPSGDGQKVSVNFQSSGRRFQSLNMSFTEPWLGGKKPNSLSVSFYNNRQSIYKSYTSKNLISRMITNGLTVGLGTRLTWPDDFFTLQHAFNVQNFSLTKDGGKFFGIPLGDGNYYNLNYQLTLSRNSVDQPLYPRKGSTFTFSFKATFPYSLFSKKDYTNSTLSDQDKYGLIEFHKWRLDAQWFTPLSKNKKLVFMTSAKFGFIGFYNRDLGTSPFERFVVGGDGLSNLNFFGFGRDIFKLRGYDVSEITPGSGAPIMSKFTMELRYPLSLSQSSTIYALAFLQGGNTWQTFRKYNPFDLKRSAGIGIRLFLPAFGLLGFDYGIGFDRNTIDGNLLNKARFNFILGFEPK